MAAEEWDGLDPEAPPEVDPRKATNSLVASARAMKIIIEIKLTRVLVWTSSNVINPHRKQAARKIKLTYIYYSDRKK